MHFFAAMKLPGTATQEENISIAMGKLDIKPGQVFLDIGCGSGAVSRPPLATLTGSTASTGERKQCKCARPGFCGQFFQGEAAAVLPGLPEVDRCFIGGTRGIDEFLPLLLEKATTGSVIVVDLARLGIAAHVTR